MTLSWTYFDAIKDPSPTPTLVAPTHLGELSLIRDLWSCCRDHIGGLPDRRLANTRTQPRYRQHQLNVGTDGVYRQEERGVHSVGWKGLKIRFSTYLDRSRISVKLTANISYHAAVAVVQDIILPTRPTTKDIGSPKFTTSSHPEFGSG